VTTGALDGIRVIEIGTLISGPFAGRLLGDMGADVIKIEPPGRPDPIRTWGQAELDGHRFLWTVHARNKRSITLDLRKPGGRRIFLDLVGRSDIVVENFRPGTLEKWDLGYDVLSETNPGLILVRISGYGQTGPDAHKPGYASVAEAASGLRHMNGFPDAPPPRLAISLGDSLAGMFAAQGALAALYRRTVTGRGQVVDTALIEACLAVQESTIPDYDVGGVVRGPSGTRLEGIAPSNIYRAADGSWIVIAANQDTVFRRLCAAMGRPELADDPDYADHLARGRNQDRLDEIIGAWAALHSPRRSHRHAVGGGRDRRTDQHRRRGGQRSPVDRPGDDRRSLGRTCEPKCQGTRNHSEAVGIAGLGPQRRARPTRPGQRRGLPRPARVLRAGTGPFERGGGSVTATHVTLREVALRDGLQIEEPIPTEAKVELLEAIAATGVTEVEATAFVSPSKVPALADAPDFAAELARFPDIAFSALVASPNGARRALDAGLNSIEYVVSAADAHSRANVGRDSAAATAAIPEIAAIAHDANATVEVIIATAWDCPFDGPTPAERVLRIVDAAVESGADRIAVADTIGTTTPGRVTALLDRVRPAIGGLPLGCHFHNTRGTGLASAYAAVLAGVNRLDASVGGVGGCPFAPGASGNIATEDLVYMLRDSGIAVDVDLERAIAAARIAQRLIGRTLPSALLRAGDRLLR